MFVYVVPKKLGVFVSGMGLLCVSVGMAGIYYGKELAIGGGVAAACVIITAVIIGFRQMQDDTRSIIQGVSQAMNAGQIDKAAVTPYFNMAQTQGARLLVDDETSNPVPSP
jgi:hypothetical protein